MLGCGIRQHIPEIHVNAQAPCRQAGKHKNTLLSSYTEGNHQRVECSPLESSWSYMWLHVVLQKRQLWRHGLDITVQALGTITVHCTMRVSQGMERVACCAVQVLIWSMHASNLHRECGWRVKHSSLAAFVTKILSSAGGVGVKKAQEDTSSAWLDGLIPGFLFQLWQEQLESLASDRFAGP